MRTCISLLAMVIVNLATAQHEAKLARIDSLVHSYNQPGKPGFAIGIMENGQLIYTRGIGVANVETGQMNTEHTVFGIASIAKQLTSACIWSLIREGKISLNDDVRKFIPEFPSYGKKKILIRHMLNHTSGIRNYHVIMDLAGFDYETEYHDNQTILDLACRQRSLNHSPGEKVIYGNTAYTMLAIIVERITGQKLDEYAKQKLFTPLGMNRTFYRTSMSMVVDDRAEGYVELPDGGYQAVIKNQVTYGAGSVGSTIEDLAVWSNVLNGLNPDYTDLTKFLTTTEKLGSGEMAKYARGVMVDEYRGVKTVHHSGYSLSGQSQIIAVPEKKLAVVILTNLESINPGPLSYEVLDYFIEEPQKGGSASFPAYMHSAGELEQFVGNYQEQHSDMKMQILLENDTLRALGSQGRRPIPLSALSKSEFVRLNNAGVRYEFTDAKKTGADLLVYFGGTPFYFSKAEFVDDKGITLTDYVGDYHSDELEVDYRIYIEDNTLFLDYPDHRHIRLSPGQKDEFGNGQRVLYRFSRGTDNRVEKIFLSAEGTVRDIEFVRK